MDRERTRNIKLNIPEDIINRVKLFFRYVFFYRKRLEHSQ